jgi:hypothetical protein
MQMTPQATGPRGFSDETVRARTGRTSAEWYAILDAWDGPSKGHTRMARYLVEEHGVSGWWAQSLTVRYEWERGLRHEAAAPDDLRAALATHPAAGERFERLQPTHQREYIEWIDEAKRPATRARRIAATVERLAAEPAEAASTGPR